MATSQRCTAHGFWDTGLEPSEAKTHHLRSLSSVSGLLNPSYDSLLVNQLIASEH